MTRNLPTQEMATSRNFLLSSVLVVSLSFPAAAGSARVLTACNQSLTSGSYILDRNLSASGDCFVATQDFITIDLARFTLSGNGSGSAVTDGGDGKEGLVVRNGGVTGFAVGIDLHARPAARISRIVAIKNTGAATTFDCNSPDVKMRLSGIATGSGGSVTDSTARSDTGVGIKARSGSRVTGKIAIGNTKAGFCVFSASTVAGNTARGERPRRGAHRVG